MKLLNSQKGIAAIVIVLVVVAVFAGFKQASKSSVIDENSTRSKDRQDPSLGIQIPNGDKKDTESTNSTITSDLVLKGMFNFGYGDPQDGGVAKHSYSVTDSQGNRKELIFINNPKYIDAESLISYDKKQVKIVGRSTQDVNIIEVLTIELD